MIFRHIVTIIMSLALCLPSALSAQKGALRKVVIDAGHGGQDPGTVSRSLKEKDINLSVALKLGALIKSNYPDVSVIFTRSTDLFVPLGERGDIANKAGADLFISIHVNNTKSNPPSGIETFVMGIDKSGSNLSVAMQENDVIEYEKDYSEKYQGYEPGSAESFIIFSIMQYSYLEQSLQFADIVQQNLIKNMRLPSRGVKQAAFLVLWRTTMPSILTELGFLGNATDAKVLGSKSGQERYARALFNAFSNYKTKTDGKGTPIVLDDSNIEEQEEKTAPTTTIPATKIEPATSSTTASSTTSSTTSTTASTTTQRDNKEVRFHVQVLASPTRLPLKDSRLTRFNDELNEFFINNIYKYCVGSCKSYQQALNLQTQVRKIVKDAFVVAMLGTEPISLLEARKMSEK